jgi:hypothetical protein
MPLDPGVFHCRAKFWLVEYAFPQVEHTKVISWRSDLLVEETLGPGENH